MKKIIAIVAALVIVLGVFAACGGEKTPEVVDVYADSTEVLTTIFAAYAEENKFPIGGGDENHMDYENPAPAMYDHTLTDELNVVAKLPASQSANIEGAANAMNMMNANSFTSAAYKLVAGADAAAFAADFKAELDNAQWMCGFPEKFVVIKTGSYIVTAYGLADFMGYFQETAVAALEGAEVILEGDIVA